MDHLHLGCVHNMNDAWIKTQPTPSLYDRSSCGAAVMAPAMTSTLRLVWSLAQHFGQRSQCQNFRLECSSACHLDDNGVFLIMGPTVKSVEAATPHWVCKLARAESLRML